MCVQSYAGKSESRWCDAANAVRNWIALIQQVFAHCKDFPRWILNPPQARKLPRYSLGLEILRNSSLNIQVYWLYTLHIFFVFFFQKKGFNTIEKEDQSQPPLMPWVGERHDIDSHGLNFWYFLWLVQGWEMLQFMLWESNRDLHVFCVHFKD